jgi:hypothetical protein
MALAMVTASVFGELYESPEQMYSRHPDRQSRDFVGSTPGYTLGWIGKTITHVGWFPRNPDTGREEARMEAFYFNDGRAMTVKDITFFMKPYARFKQSEWQKLAGKNTFATLSNSNGVKVAIVVYQPGLNLLSIWTPPTFQAFWDSTQPKSAPSGAFDDLAPPRSSPKQQKKRDCMIVATELLHRLADKSAWSNILMFSQTVNGQKLAFGHAVAVWKLTPEGNVFAADDDGTFELETTSTDAGDVLVALGTKYSTETGYNVALNGHFAK